MGRHINYIKYTHSLAIHCARQPVARPLQLFTAVKICRQT